MRANDKKSRLRRGTGTLTRMFRSPPGRDRTLLVTVARANIIRVPPVRRAPRLSLLLLLLLWLQALVVPAVSCTPPDPCRDPTNAGNCFCPIGQSCHHRCGEATGHCTLGCSQGNPACSVTCGDDCTALCSGSGRCDAVCGEHCNVSCERVTHRCVAAVGAHSRVNCEGAADCEVRCTGSCDVVCPAGRCQLHCAPGADCEMDCGGAGPSSDRPVVCPDGTRVCGRPC